MTGVFEAVSYELGKENINIFGMLTVEGRQVQICVFVGLSASVRPLVILAGGIMLYWWPVRRRDRFDAAISIAAVDMLRVIGERLEHVDWLPEILSRGPRPVRRWSFEMKMNDGSIPPDLMAAVSGPDDIDIYMQLRSNCAQKCSFCPNDSPVFDRSDQDADFEFVSLLAERVVIPARSNGIRATIGIHADDGSAHSRLATIMGLIYEFCGCPVHLVMPSSRLVSSEVVAAIARLPGLLKLSTSIFGASAAVHDDVAGRPGAFVETVHALRNLMSFPIWTQGNLVLTRGAVPEIGAVLDTLVHFGLDVMIQGLLADCAAHEPVLGSLLPEFASLREVLEKSSDRILAAARIVNVEFSDLPACAIPPGLRGLATVHHARPELYRHVLADRCAGCVHAAGCIGVFEGYLEVHGDSGLVPEPV